MHTPALAHLLKLVTQELINRDAKASSVAANYVDIVLNQQGSSIRDSTSVLGSFWLPSWAGSPSRKTLLSSEAA